MRQCWFELKSVECVYSPMSLLFIVLYIGVFYSMYTQHNLHNTKHTLSPLLVTICLSVYLSDWHHSIDITPNQSDLIYKNIQT